MATKKLASLLVKVGVNGVEVEKEFRTLEKKAENLGKNLQSFGKKYSVAVTAPLIAAGYGAAKAADVQLKAEARLLTALKGREDIQQRLIAQAGDIQSRSTFGDEEIIAQQAYLASLGLTESQIKRVIDASVELSVATGSSLDSAVRNLAKTYGGLTGELGESIPALKNLTKEQLTNGEAVQYILDNYKGYAETTLEGLGSTEQLKNMIGDLGEQLGAVLLPVIKDVVSGLTDFVKWMQQLSPATQKVAVGVAALLAAAGPLTTVLGSVAKGVTMVYKAITLATPAIVAGATPALAGLGTKLAGLAAMVTPTGALVVGLTAIASLFVLLKSRADAAREAMAAFREAGRDENKQYFYDLALKLNANKSDKEIEAELARLRADNADILAMRNSQGGSLTEGQLSSIANNTAQIDALKELLAQRKANTVAIEDMTAATKKLGEEQQKLKEQSITKVEGVETANPFGAGQNLMGALMTDIPEGIQSSNWMTDLFNRWKEWETEASGIRELASSVASTLEGAAEEVAVSIGEGLGNLITGETFNPGSKILEIFGKTLKSLGSALVSFGITMEAFKKSLKTIFANPWAAIATGVAAIAAGTVFMNMAKQPIKLAKGGLAYGPTLAVVGDNPNAANDPEVIAPLSKLRSMGGASRLELTGEVEWVLSGSSLRAVLNKENFRVARLG